MITTTYGTCHAIRWCDGCDREIAPGTPFLEHEERDERVDGSIPERLAECLACAARNGRPGYSEPDVPEQPLHLCGIA